MVQYSCATNAAISSSRSQIMRSAGLCTRPADSPRRTFFHKQRGQVESDQIIERAARLLGVYQLEAEPARLADRRADSVARDLVEHHAVHFLAIEITARLEDLAQVPGNGLTFAIRIGGEIQRPRLRERAGDGVHVALVLLEYLVLHGVAVVRVDRAFLGHEIAHVPVGGEHLEVPAQVLLDGLGLGGRFNDDQVVCHERKKLEP